MKDLIQFLNDPVASAAVVHLVHVAWPNIKIAALSVQRVYPYVRNNGGVIRIIRDAFWVPADVHYNNTNKTETTNTNQNEKTTT